MGNFGGVYYCNPAAYYYHDTQDFSRRTPNETRKRILRYKGIAGSTGSMEAVFFLSLVDTFSFFLIFFETKMRPPLAKRKK
jgi:hypothetical protein